MKLRIQDNSIRFRLTRSEVHKLAAEGRVKSSVQFAPGPNAALTYSIETSLSGEIHARRTPNEICVMLPKQAAEAWATSEEVTIEHFQIVAPDVKLHIVVEKDFRCAHRLDSAEENAANLYPNPTAGIESSE